MAAAAHRRHHPEHLLPTLANIEGEVEALASRSASSAVARTHRIQASQARLQPGHVHSEGIQLTLRITPHLTHSGTLLVQHLIELEYHALRRSPALHQALQATPSLTTQRPAAEPTSAATKCRSKLRNAAMALTE
jgi:hypothetical protein